MRALGALTSMALLATLLAGCSLFHPHVSQQAKAPPLQTGQGALEQQEKEQHQAPPPSTPPQPEAQAIPPPLPPVRQPKVRHHPRKAKHPDKSQPAATAEVQQKTDAAPGPPGSLAASPIGQLTTGDSATQAGTKHTTLTLISTTQQGLSEIKRSLSTEEQTIVAQIRAFLKQAQQALDNGDSDGAFTLATKAKLLLEELVKPR